MHWLHLSADQDTADVAWMCHGAHAHHKTCNFNLHPVFVPAQPNISSAAVIEKATDTKVVLKVDGTTAAGASDATLPQFSSLFCRGHLRLFVCTTRT